MSNNSTIHYITKTFEIICFFDIFVSINTGIYIKGHLCRNRKKIFDSYVKGDFAYDLLVNLPLLTSIFISSNGMVIRCIYLVSLLRFRHINQKVNKFFNYLQVTT